MNHLSNLPMNLQRVNSTEVGFEPRQYVQKRKMTITEGGSKEGLFCF